MQISCKCVTLSYEGKSVISNLSFELYKGDYLCIVGENGSGKSTLVKGLLGLKKPSSGEIIINSERIGYLPQATSIQKDFPASVFEVVLSGCLNDKSFFPFYTKKQKKRALSAMEKLEISDLKNKCFRNLSGGQKQKVLLSRAICATEDLILLDEPVTGLDPLASVEMYDLISQINKKGTTVIMVSHDINHAIENATKILHLSESETFFGKTNEYLKSDLYNNLKGGKS